MLAMPKSPIKTVLGFDYGEKKIGVAFGQMITQSAAPVSILKAIDGQPNWLEVEKLIKQWKPDCIVVGLPLNMDGTDTTVAPGAKKLANRIHGRFGLEVHLVDERLSSKGVAYVLDEIGDERKNRGQIDDLAACLIVESFLKSL